MVRFALQQCSSCWVCVVSSPKYPQILKPRSISKTSKPVLSSGDTNKWVFLKISRIILSKGKTPLFLLIGWSFITFIYQKLNFEWLYLRSGWSGKCLRYWNEVRVVYWTCVHTQCGKTRLRSSAVSQADDERAEKPSLISSSRVQQFPKTAAQDKPSTASTSEGLG